MYATLRHPPVFDYFKYLLILRRTTKIKKPLNDLNFRSCCRTQRCIVLLKNGRNVYGRMVRVLNDSNCVMHRLNSQKIVKLQSKRNTWHAFSKEGFNFIASCFTTSIESSGSPRCNVMPSCWEIEVLSWCVFVRTKRSWHATISISPSKPEKILS